MTVAQIEQLRLESPLAVKNCSDGPMALRMNIAATSMGQDDLAIASGTNKRSITRALSGSCGLGIDTLLRIMRETRSVYLLQYMCRQMGGEFKPYSKEQLELQEMEERMAELKAKIAA